jgi:ferredoxin-type protein NapF
LNKADAIDEAPPGSAPWRRWLLRFAFLLVALGLILPAWPWDGAVLAVPSVSPYTAIVSAVATRAITLSTLLAAPVLLVVLVRRRWFCRYACPTGLLVDLAGRLRRRSGAARTRLLPLGQWLALLTVGGACLGYPLFLWLDPLAIFTGFFNAWGRDLDWAGWLCAALLPVVLAMGLLWPGLWCSRLCPLGATQDLLASLSRRVGRRDTGTAAAQPGWPLARRVLLAAGLGAVGGAWMIRGTILGRRKPLRPPGAAEESQFAGLCERCGNCARVCPTRILRPDVGQFGAESFLTPLVHYEDGYCLETCRRCTHVCPSGALRRLAAEDKPQVTIGLPRVDMSVCLLGEDRECAICRRACPYEAIKMVFSEIDYLTTPQIDPQRCNGCGACQVKCPTTPTKAIVVYPC